MSAVLSVFALECAASGAIRISNIGPIYDQRFDAFDAALMTPPRGFFPGDGRDVSRLAQCDAFSLHGYHDPKTLCTDHTLILQ